MKRRRGPGPDAESTANSTHDDDLVELTRVAFAGEAIAIKQDLERIGIPAAVFESDAGGWAPYLAVWTGTRVMVRAGDRARAELLLSDTGGQRGVEPEPSSSTPAVRKHVRHPGDG